MDRLKDKVALITGGGAGIGAATGELFCREGAAVPLVDRDAKALDETAAAIKVKLPRARVAHEEAALGVRANAVCPGSTLTTFHIERGKATGRTMEELRNARSDNSLLGRWASPEEIAYPILWLASDEASFVTGATLLVDGRLSIL